MGELLLTDLDGDRLEAKPVYGLGSPYLAIFCFEEGGDLCGVALKAEDVVRLRDYLTDFIEAAGKPSGSGISCEGGS